MRFEIRDGALHLTLDEGDRVVARATAVREASRALRRAAHPSARWWRGLGWPPLDVVTAEDPDQGLILAPATSGEPAHVGCAGGPIVVRPGAWLASAGPAVERRWLGTLGPVVRCDGAGDLWLAGHGPVHRRRVRGSCAVDPAHLVAFEASLTCRVHALGDARSLLLSGEGRVCELTGDGDLWYQTRTARGLSRYLRR